MLYHCRLFNLPANVVKISGCFDNYRAKSFFLPL